VWDGNFSAGDWAAVDSFGILRRAVSVPWWVWCGARRRHGHASVTQWRGFPADSQWTGLETSAFLPHDVRKRL